MNKLKESGANVSSNRMPRRLAQISLLVATVILSAGMASAVPITGQINFYDTAFTATGGTGLGDATALAFSNPVQIIQKSGSFSSIAPGITANFSDLQFAPFSSSGSQLWSAGIFSFRLDSIAINFQSSTQLNLSGTGVLSAIGYDPTPGTWSFQGGGTAMFTFISNTTAIPDAGNTCLLLGIALTGLGLGNVSKSRTLKSHPIL